MPKFYTEFDNVKPDPESNFPTDRPIFQESFKDGLPILVEVDRDYFQDAMNEAFEDTNIASVVRRFTAGDDTVVNHNKNLVYDFNGEDQVITPEDYDKALIINRVVNAEFDKLSVDDKEKVGYNAYEWVKTIYGLQGRIDTSKEMLLSDDSASSSSASLPDSKINESEVKNNG